MSSAPARPGRGAFGARGRSLRSIAQGGHHAAAAAARIAERPPPSTTRPSACLTHTHRPARYLTGAERSTYSPTRTRLAITPLPSTRTRRGEGERGRDRAGPHTVDAAVGAHAGVRSSQEGVPDSQQRTPGRPLRRPPPASRPPPTPPPTTTGPSPLAPKHAQSQQPHYSQQGSLIPARRLRPTPNTTSTRRC